MAKELSMRKIHEILRLHYEHGLSGRQIASSCQIARSTVGEYIKRATAAGLTWPLPAELDDERLSRLLFCAPDSEQEPSTHLPDMAYLHKELRRDKGVTLQLLWEEYKQSDPSGYQYSQFCEHYRRWLRKVTVCLRQDYRGGEKMFVDYAGQKIAIRDPESGHTSYASLFVAVLGASNYTYAEATETEQLPDWIQSHVNAWNFFRGVAQITVPDNLKAGVAKACRYEPDLNPTYQELATHYKTAVIPARRAKPKDKAKVESGVLIGERWILAVLRHRQFFSLAELNQAIAGLLVKLNQKPFKKMKGSRAEWYRELDVPALRPLPERAYEYGEWKKSRVNIDYHVEVESHYYSVPYTLVKEEVDTRLTARAVEIFHKGQRVAAHARSHVKYTSTTLEAHRPKAHREYLAWPPSRIIAWAEKTGTFCAQVVERILAEKPHPEMGYRSCMGLIRLSKLYGAERVEAASKRALAANACSYKSIGSMLKNSLDKEPWPGQAVPLRVVDHANIRGQAYYGT
jgi:transposase